VTKFLSQLQPIHYLKWLNRGLDAYNLCAAFTGMFSSRYSLSQTANHSIMLINLPKLPADRIHVLRRIVAADSHHCAA
jgi:hypothetical protein